MEYISPKDGKTNHGMVLEEISLTNFPGDINLDQIVALSNKMLDNKKTQEMTCKIRKK